MDDITYYTGRRNQTFAVNHTRGLTAAFDTLKDEGWRLVHHCPGLAEAHFTKTEKLPLQIIIKSGGQPEWDELLRTGTRREQ